MQANELMLGDWVMFVDDPIQVEEISHDGINSDWDECKGVYFYEDLEPILITPEILKKNGFEMDRIVYILYFDGSHDTNYMSVAFNEEREVTSLCIDMAYCGVVIATTIHHVHELQQALRLMGKYDLANNFKI